jgi:rfaE bifunctional protein kinase chain/domain
MSDTEIKDVPKPPAAGGQLPPGRGAATGKRAPAGGRRRHARPLLVRRRLAHLAGSAGAGGAHRTREERLGGAANVARNAAALGAHCGLLGVVGNDEAGDQVERILRESSIDSYLKRDEAISTIIKLRVIGRQQQMVRIDFEDAPTETVLRDKLTQFKALLPDYDVIVLSDYNKGSLVNVAEMIQAARAAGKTVMVDPKGDDFTPYAAPPC